MTGNVATVPAVPVDPATAKAIAAAAKRARESTIERDRLIVQAYRAGGGMREIARLAGLTHPGVRRILERDGAL